MVVGLGGASLPPRRRGSSGQGDGNVGAAPESAKDPLPRVHSSSRLLTTLLHPHGLAGGVLAADDAVATPRGGAPLPQQPARSDQSHNATAQAGALADDAAAGGVPLQHPQVQQDRREQMQGGQQFDGQQGQQEGHQRAVEGYPTGPAPATSAAAGDAAAAAHSGSTAGPTRRKRGRLSAQQASPQQPKQPKHSSRPGRRRSRLAPAEATPAGSSRSGSRGRSAAGPASALAVTAVAEGGPTAKRRKVAAGAGGARRSKYSDILHRLVEVPGDVFGVEPGEVFIGRVNKAESGRRVPSMEVQFLDDASKYWFPVEDVRRWMADMVQTGSWEEHNPGVPAPDFAGILAAAASPAGEGEEHVAAKALQSLSASLASRPGASSRSGGARPAVSSGPRRRQKRRQSDAGTAACGGGGGGGEADSGVLVRSGSELKRVGALDIMACAAGGLSGMGGSPRV